MSKAFYSLYRSPSPHGGWRVVITRRRIRRGLIAQLTRRSFRRAVDRNSARIRVNRYRAPGERADDARHPP